MSGRMFARLGRVGRRPGQEGAVAVEFALVLPILAMLLLGTVTAGLAYTHSLGLTNAVREGSRFAAITPYPPLDASGNPVADPAGVWSDDVIQRTRDTQFDDPDEVTKICVDLYKQGDAVPLLVSECSTSSITEAPGAFVAPASTPAGTCVVRVWAARTFDINAILLVFDDQLMTRQSVAVYERKPCN